MSKSRRFCVRNHRAANCPCPNEGHLMFDDYDWSELIAASQWLISVVEMTDFAMPSNRYRNPDSENQGTRNE